MKLYLYLFLVLFSFSGVVYAQNDYNRLSLEINGGFNKPMAPLTPGFLSPTLNMGHLEFGARYMFNTKFGVLVDGNLGTFREASGSSPEFRSTYSGFNVQGVMNLGRVFSFENFAERISILLHAGPGISYLKHDVRPTIDFDADRVYVINSGLTGLYRISNRISLSGDVSLMINGRQRYTFDGNSFTQGIIQAPGDTRLSNTTGTWWTGTLGIAFYLGKQKTHADWYVSPERYATKQELADQIGDIKDMLKDSDNDGIADIFDKEPNTPEGARVDFQGRTLDSDGDGIPDHLDNCPFQPGPASNNGCPIIETIEVDYFKKAINENYVNVYFAFDSSRPLAYSTSAVNFAANFLKRNPGASLEIKGFADEIGPENYNMKLSERRAKAVYDLLIAAGIDANRLSYKGYGEDTSVDKRSPEARQLTRRTSFEVK